MLISPPFLAAPRPESPSVSQDYINFIDEIALKSENPEWVGLPSTAEMVLRVKSGGVFSLALLKLQEDDTAGGGGAGSDREKINAAMIEFADTYLTQLPSSIDDITEAAGGKEKTPLERFFERELGQCKSVLKMLRGDLTDLKLVAQGEMKSTNRSRELLAAVNKGEVPPMWRKYAVPDLPINAWIADFILRQEQVIRLAAVVIAGAKDNIRGLSDKLWVGGFFGPIAFLTATQQTAAAALGAALELLELVVDVVGEDDGFTDGAPVGTQYLVQNSFLEGAAWADGALATSDEMVVRLPMVRLTWIKTGIDAAFAWRLHCLRGKDTAFALCVSPLSSRRLRQ